MLSGSVKIRKIKINSCEGVLGCDLSELGNDYEVKNIDCLH